jgi:hypothetical protein
VKPVTPDGLFVIAGDRRGLALYPLAGGDPQPIAGLSPGDVPLGWAADGRSLYLRGPGLRPPVKVSRLDLASGARTAWKELAPTDDVGVTALHSIRITPDGSAYAYTYTRVLSDLYLVAGLR